MKISVSGIRGIVPRELNPENIVRFVNAFARLVQGRNLVLARDTRVHGQAIYDIVGSTLALLGRNVYALGISPTPTAQFVNRKYNMDGGIIVSASHNPQEWNALKLSMKGGRFLYKEELERLLEFYEHPEWRDEPLGRIVDMSDALDEHIQAILNSEYVRIPERKVEVMVDCVNGAMYRALPELLGRMNANVRKIYCEPTGKFERPPEPRKENLRHLEGRISEIAFATDPDGDRIAFGIREFGMLSEEYTVALCIDYLLNFVRSDVVVNYSTSMLVEFVARKYGVRVVRTKVGEANVLSKMEEVGSILGGEGNGGLIFPPINATRDGLVASAILLSSYATGKLIETLKELPRTYMVKLSLRNVEPEDIVSKLSVLDEFQFNYEDGIYMRKGYRWIHVRPSNTEPIVRVYAESLDESFVLEVKTLIDSMKS